MRRLTVVSTMTALKRTMFVFSQQSPILESNQKKLKSDLNVWVEEWEIKRLGVAVVDNAPTTLTLQKTLELYNFNDLENPPHDVVEMPTHTSFQTRNPYGNKLQLELSDRALKKGYNSKFWIGSSQIKSHNFVLKQGARPSVVISGGQAKVFHVSQLSDSERISRWPVSGGTRRPYQGNSDTFRQLSEAVAMNNYSSGLFFTKKQMENLKLAAASNQVPVILQVAADTRGANVYYNLDQLELPEAALLHLNRAEPDVPSFLLSGEPLRRADLLPTRFKSKFWLSIKDARFHGFNVKAAELNNGVSLSSKINTIDMFHAEQMQDVTLAYKMAGLYTQ